MEMLTEPFLGGAFNYPILFGVQVYFYLFIVAVLLIVFSEIGWRAAYWQPMLPFQGLWESYRDFSKAAFVTDLKLNWNLMREGAAKLIFDKEDYDFVFNTGGWTVWGFHIPSFTQFRAWLFKSDFSAQIAKKLQLDWDDYPIVTIGVVPTDLIIDANHLTEKDSPDRKKMKHITEVWNEGNDNDQIHTISKFFRYVGLGKINPGDIPLYVTIPWTRVDSAFPKKGDRSDAAWGGTVRQIHSDLKANENKSLATWAYVILAFSALICLLMAAMHFLFKSAPPPV